MVAVHRASSVIIQGKQRGYLPLNAHVGDMQHILSSARYMQCSPIAWLLISEENNRGYK